MKIEENIEKLFAEEPLEILEGQDSKELPTLPLQSPAASEAIKPDERREFNRANVSEHKLAIQFTSEAQFARQYIDNISLGGLFIKTTERHPMGTLIPIEFSIPHPSAPEGKALFQLMAKVCRITDNGLGLEFTNLSQENRQYLEDFVREALPKGLPVVAKPKASAVANLDKLRTSRIELSKKRTDKLKKYGAIGLLFVLNAYLVHETVQQELNIASFRHEAVRLKDQEIPVHQIRAIEKTKDNQWVIRLGKDRSISVNQNEINDTQLPQYLQTSVDLLKTMPVRKKIRQSKNTRGLTSSRR